MQRNEAIAARREGPVLKECITSPYAWGIEKGGQDGSIVPIKQEQQQVQHRLREVVRTVGDDWDGGYRHAGCDHAAQLYVEEERYPRCDH